MSKGQARLVFVDSSPTTHLVVCNVCGSRWLFADRERAQYFGGRHRDYEKRFAKALTSTRTEAAR
jgi:DNA-directed RNA polymerase subunit RPC12/RpoP